MNSYDGRVEFFQYDNANDPTCDLCMIGDSLTQYYDLDRYFPTIKSKNRGISGDTTSSLRARLTQSIGGMKPKTTLLLIGANNVSTFQNDYESLIEEVRALLPDSEIYLISITPTCNAYQVYMPAISEKNAFILELSKKYSMGYIDLFTPLSDENTGLLKEEYTFDGQHFSESGYETITKNLSPYLS